MCKLVFRRLLLNGLAVCALVATWAQNVAFAQAKQPGVAPTADAATPARTAVPTKSAPASKTAPASIDTPAANKQAAAPKAPAWIEKALRARVEGMLLARKEGSFQKAYDFVAPDSRDYFFQMEKVAISSYKIEEIQWSDKFTRAVVRVSTIRKTRLMGVPTEVDLPGRLEESWKNLGGRWLWWHDPNLDRTGLLAIPSSSTQPTAPGATGDGKKPPVPSDVSPTAVAAAGKSIGPAVTLDKNVFRFTEGVAGTDEVVFSNTNNGEVRVQAEVLFQPKEFSIEPRDTWLKPGEKLTIKVRYTPSDSVPGNNLRVRIYVDPFEITYEMPIRFSPASKVP